MTTTTQSSFKLKGVPALIALIVVIAGFGWWFYPMQADVPPQAQVRIKEALLNAYEDDLAMKAFQQSDALAQARGLKLLDENRKARVNTVDIVIIKAWDNKTRNKLMVTVQPSFNAGPPPDGIAKRTLTLTPKGINDWEVQPLGPSGAPPLLE